MQRTAIRSIAEGLAAQAAARGANVAIDDGVTQLTYREMVDQAAALACTIAALPDAEAPIGVFLPPSAGYIVAVVALAMAGRISVPLNDGHPAARTAQIIKRASLASVIVDRQTAVAMRAIAPALRQICSPEKGVLVPPVEYRPNPHPGDIFTISFSSGSTGEPKGICRSEASLLSRLETFVPALPLTPDDRVPILESLSIGMSINLALNILLTGGRLGIIDMPRLGLSATISRLAAFQPTVLAVVPATLRTLMALNDPELMRVTASIRWVRTGGEAVQHSDVAIYRRCFPETCRLFVALGAGETGTIASWGIDHKTVLDRPLVPVGYPERGVTLELLDDDGAPVGPGETGEIFVTSEALALGYWRDESQTRARFGFSPTSPGTRRYRTGDFGRFLPDGMVEFVGRRDRQVKIRGNTVHLAEIEATLSRCAGIAQVAVIARADAQGPVLVAYWSAASEDGKTAIRLREWIRDTLPAPMQPTHLVQLASFPRLPDGKSDLIALEAMDRRRVVDTAPAERDATPPDRSPADVAAIVRQAWTEILPGRSFDDDLAFDEAGGDSLKGLTLVLAMETALKRRLAVGTLDLQTRPSDLIDRVARGVRAVSARDPTQPFLVFFSGVLGDDVSASAFFRRLLGSYGALGIDYRIGGDVLTGDFKAERFFAETLVAIRRASPHQRLWLIGYSFGGKVAAETARLLIESGTPVEAVISLDGAAGGRKLLPSKEIRDKLWIRIRNGLAKHQGIRKFVIHHIAFRLWRHAERWQARGTLLALIARFGSAESLRIIAAMTRAHRHVAAFGRLPTSPLPAPLWLIATEDPLHDPSRPDLGWEGRCLRLHRLDVGGTHLTMLNAPTADRVMARLAEIEIALRGKAADAA